MAVAPSTRGFGFAICDTPESFVDWGVKAVKGEKNSASLANVLKLIVQYQPDVLALTDHSLSDSRRSPRIKALSQELIGLAASRNIKLALISNEKLRRFFFGDKKGTKDALAEILAQRFPKELGFRLPPKRRPWMSEDYRMDIFDAMALIVVFLRKRPPNEAKPK